MFKELFTSKRLQSFSWRVLMMSVAFGLSTAAENLGGLQLDPTVTTILGLFLGEMSKAIANSLKAS